MTFLVFTSFVVFGGYRQLGFSAAVLIVFYLFQRSDTSHHWRFTWQMLKRMRWLFLSMLVIYLWFTPGQAVLPVLADYSPTWQGIKMAGHRIGSLIVIVIAVNTAIKSTSTERITSGLLWLLTPLRYVGLPHERLALRITLTFKMISEVQYDYDLLKRSRQASPPDKQERAIGFAFLQRLDRLGELGANLFTNVVNKTQQTDQLYIELPADGAPPFHQWGLPLILAVGFILVKVL